MPFRVAARGSGDRVEIRDVPWGLWLFGGLFVLSGAVVLSIPVLSTQWAAFTPWERLGVGVIGAGHLAGGLWTIRRHAATVTTVARASGEGHHAVRRPFARRPRVARFRLADVRAVSLGRDRDADGDPMFRLELWLAGRRMLPLQDQPAHGERRALARADEVRTALGLPAGSSPPGTAH